MTRVVRDPGEIADFVAMLRRSRISVGLVPTMGALHEGHASLIRRSYHENDRTIVSVYVNPLQFGAGEDLERYPRTLDDDVGLCHRERADIVFAPSVKDMQPPGRATVVSVHGLADAFEGARRPGHFDGVATIVARLLNLVQPDVAYFGQKDYQQSVVVRRLVTDLAFPSRIVVCPIVRDADGLALSSRNRYLTDEDRVEALRLPRTLEQVESLVRAGETDGDVLRAAMADGLASPREDVEMEYGDVVSPLTLQPLERVVGHATLLAVLRVAGTRLLDNRLVAAPRLAGLGGVTLAREVDELCRGKLNLFLDVVGRRGDGFHELVTVFHEVDLADELVVREWPDAPRARSVRVRLLDGSVDAHDVPRDERNLAARAALRLLEVAGSDRSVEIDITKHVPSGAGLGGGSADAAGALRGVNRLLDFHADVTELERLAADIGSDVPFLIRGGTAIGRGRGELLDPLPSAYGLRFLLLIPSFGIATGDVFRALPNTLPPPVSPAALRRALETGDVAGLAAATHNALISAAITVEPRFHAFLQHARAQMGDGVQMTGSGSTLFLPTESHVAPDTGGWPFGTRALLVHSA